MSGADIKSQAVKGVVWTMVERYSGQIVQFIISVVLARILPPSHYGLIAMLAIFMGLSSVFIDGGFSSALIQCKNRVERDFSTVFFINVGMALFIYMLLFISAPWIAEFYSQPQLTQIVRIYCLSLPINSLASTSNVMLVVKLDFKTTTKISLTSAIVSGIIGIICACYGFGVWALVTQALVAAFLNLILTVFFVRWFPTAGFSRDSFHRLFSFSSKLFVASVISSVYENITGAVIGKQFNAATLAYYSRAYSFNVLVNSNITNVLGRVSYPLLSQIQDDDDRLKRIYEKYIQMSAFFSFFALMLLCAVAKPLVLFLLTDKWAASIIFIQILSFGMMTDGVIVSNLNLLKVKGRSDLVLKLEVIKKITAFTILGISIAMNSVMAICIGKAIYGAVFALYINTYYTKKLMDYGFKRQFMQFLPYLIASLVMMVAGYMLCNFISNSLLALCVSVPVCVLIYLFLCSRMKLYAYFEAKRILFQYIKKVRSHN